MIGKKLGHYEIIETLGSGGMGEVYKAKDLKLGRHVAIKVLPEELASDQERLKRFEQEARAASALDHPNIITIHDISEVEGTHFIVMQYVEGKNLRELMQEGRLDLKKALHFAIQTADGLARAHGKGIVHRDLKPDNIMVTEDGLVKILDFGLAKLAEPGELSEASTKDMELKTKEGHVLGTAPYMSPEQAQGKEVDHRSDIFSFGSVLYEMVTGRRAFAAQSLPELLTAIIREEPSKVSEIAPSIPLELEKLITRALRKEPERRWQSFPDIRVELQEIKEELESGSFVSAEQAITAGARRVGKARLWFAALLVLLAVGVGGWWYLSTSEPARPPTRTIPLTTYPGSEYQPALSPDGNLVAFTRAGESGVRDLHVKMIDGGEPLLVSRGSRSASSPAWSPDGRRIAFCRRVEGRNGEMVVGIFDVPYMGGGAERQIATSRAGSGLSWSPDGKLLAMVDRESEEPKGIYLRAFESGEKRRLTTPPARYSDGDSSPRFSPDGELVAFVRGSMLGQADIWVVSTGGGEPQQLTSDNQNIAGLDWTSDGQSIVFSSSREGRAGVWSLWRISVSGGEPELLEVVEQGRRPTLSRLGERLAYVRTDHKMDIWRVGGPSAGEEEKKSPAPFISSTWNDYMPQYSPDGKQIQFTSSRSGHQEIWICDSDGENLRPLTFLEDPATMHGNWSPDGREIAFMSSKEGTFDIYVVSTTGALRGPLTTGPWSDTGPSWSRDGGWIYFTSNRSGGQQIWKMPSEGGDAIQMTDNGGAIAYESPDGRFLYFTKSSPEGGPPGIWRIPANGGAEEQLIENSGFIYWAVLEKGIYYLNHQADPGPAIEIFEFATGEIRTVSVLEDPPGGGGFSLSPDGRWFLYVHREFESDIMLVENFR